jgi:hypothetical protein
MSLDDMSARSRLAQEWEAHRDIITRLYLNENRNLEEVRTILALEHEFKAT